mgnify:CR=1 FL=1
MEGEYLIANSNSIFIFSLFYFVCIGSINEETDVMQLPVGSVQYSQTESGGGYLLLSHILFLFLRLSLFRVGVGVAW